VGRKERGPAQPHQKDKNHQPVSLGLVGGGERTGLEVVFVEEGTPNGGAFTDKKRMTRKMQFREGGGNLLDVRTRTEGPSMHLHSESLFAGY